jgi:hypothetical protein
VRSDATSKPSMPHGVMLNDLNLRRMSRLIGNHPLRGMSTGRRAHGIETRLFDAVLTGAVNPGSAWQVHRTMYT